MLTHPLRQVTRNSSLALLPQRLRYFSPRSFSTALEDPETTTNANSQPYVSAPKNDVVEELVKHVGQEQPVLLNSKEHAVGYLGRILNARVYEAAVETKLQHAVNLSNHLQNTGKWNTYH